LLLVADGAQEATIRRYRKLLEQEGAEVYVTTSLPFLSVTTVNDDLRGEEVMVDIPLELVDVKMFDGVIVPNGSLCAEALYADPIVVRLIERFIGLRKRVILSGEVREWAAEGICEESNVCVLDYIGLQWHVHVLQFLLGDTSTVVIR